MNKSDRYGWKSIPDEIPELKFIHKMDINIDESYQRIANEKKVLRIASEWEWKGCGAILIADRMGKYYAFDAQHRVLAARKRDEITMLPCVVYKTKLRATEARAFLKSNTDRKPLALNDKFKALLTAHDEHAIALEEYIHSKGYTFANAGISKGTKSTQISSINTCYELYKANCVLFKTAFDLLVEISDGFLLTGQHIKGFYQLVLTMHNRKKNILDHKDAILKLTLQDIDNAIAQACSYHRKSNPSVWMRGIANEINRRTRKNRITIFEA